MDRETEGSVKSTAPPRTQDASPPDHLDSWKAIASYLNRTVRTVQRWEKRERLPIRRHRHQKGSSVHSSKHEIDEWRKNRSIAAHYSLLIPSALNGADTRSPLSQAVLLGLATETDSAQRDALLSNAEPCGVFILYCVGATPISSGDSESHRAGVSELSSLTWSVPEGPVPSGRMTLERASRQRSKKCTI